MEIKKNIGHRIRQIRANCKMTQMQLAKTLQVSPATISAWEIGDIGPSVEASIRIAEFGKVSLDWLLLGKASANNSDMIDGHTPEELKLLENYRRLTRTSQTALLRVGEMMQK